MKDNKNRVKSTLTIIANTILVLLILLGGIISFSLLPIKNNYKILAVMSGSMAPTIPTGSLIVIKPRPLYKVGDIITFKSSRPTVVDKDLTTHRVNGIEYASGGKRVYVTKGDANKDPDFDKIDQDKVVGKEIFKIKLLGYLLGYIKTLPGLIIIIIIPAAIIIYEEIKKILHEVRNIRAKKQKSPKNNAAKTKKTIIDITVDKKKK